MRTIDSKVITKTVKELCIKANTELRRDILHALNLAKKKETNPKAKRILDIIIGNAIIARRKKAPICQDTGMVVLYLKVGQDIKIKGGLNKAAEKGVREAYRVSYFRKSIVKDPFIRKNTNTNLPPLIYTQIIPGNKIDIRVAVKGFGCENMSKTSMFRPVDSISVIEDFVVNTVKESGTKACPPMYIGVGIGGTLDKAVALSREAIFRPVNKVSEIPYIARLEQSILKKVNRLKIGPIGAVGKTTALGVSVLTHPTHIAGLPVAVYASCHATRDARKMV